MHALIVYGNPTGHSMRNRRPFGINSNGDPTRRMRIVVPEAP
jgi:hypothetical protein